jgi:hypothetical protein
VTADLTWAQNHPIPGDEYDWRQEETTFFTGELDYAELRFVAVAHARIWIDGVSILEMPPGFSE